MVRAGSVHVVLVGIENPPEVPSSMFGRIASGSLCRALQTGRPANAVIDHAPPFAVRMPPRAAAHSMRKRSLFLRCNEEVVDNRPGGVVDDRWATIDHLPRMLSACGGAL
jgi:hypothetical protein